MKKATSLISAAMLLALTAAPVHALPFAAAQPSAPPANAIVHVQASCNAVAQSIAAQYGGRPGNVRMETRDGRKVCVGEVIVPAKDGQMGRKIPFEQPL